MAGFVREVAHRVFAKELKDSNLATKDEDDQYASQHILTPTGAKVSRIFFVGTLIEVENIGKDAGYWRGRVTDPTGSFMVYAGQYQPEAAQFLSECELPAFIAVVGKTSTYTTDDGNVLTSIRPESINAVDEATRDLWIRETAALTIDRINAFEIGEDPNSKAAKEHYSTDTDSYLSMVGNAVESLNS
jgi:RPA family protein